MCSTFLLQGSGQVHWIFKNKDHGKMSATASLGLITQWDVEGALPQIDKWIGWQQWGRVVGGGVGGVGGGKGT
jgi:26S proteasome regulatory subunit N1